MKKWKKLWIAFLVIFLITGCTSTKEKPKDTATNTTEKTEIVFPVNQHLYKITAPDGKYAYVLGTMHIGEKYDTFDSTTLDAFADSDVLALELDFTKTSNEATNKMYYEGSIAESDVDPALLEKLDTLKETYPSLKNIEDLSIYNAMAISSMASADVYTELGYNPLNGIDFTLQSMATKADKEIVEVEGMDTQAEYVMQIGHQCPNMVLSQLFNKEASIASTKLLAAAYRDGNEVFFNAMSSTELTEASLANVPYSEEAIIYTDILINNRNTENFIPKVISYIESDKTHFVAVGLLHVIGDTGIVKQLEAQGYTITHLK